MRPIQMRSNERRYLVALPVVAAERPRARTVECKYQLCGAAPAEQLTHRVTTRVTTIGFALRIKRYDTQMRRLVLAFTSEGDARSVR